MRKPNLVAVQCIFSKGFFSSERAFEVKLADGKLHSGPAPLHYCWNEHRKPLGEGEAIENEVRGFVAARIVDAELPESQIAVEVPDGEVLALFETAVGERPTSVMASSVRA